MTWLLLPLALASGGLAAGGLMIASLGGAPLLERLPRDEYIPVHQFLVTRFDPFMPICMITATACDLALMFMVPGAVRIPLLVALATLLGAIYVSLVKNVPINRWVAGLDLEDLPEDWESVDPRVRWRNWNLLRTAFAVAALAGNAVAASLVLGGV
ncbi:DUF1772 domain-containing protein [Nonomuraea sediminis]|uniref:DUF1772 domain-containing protein n=1 Tax=Nonomuraea sediminis TaxID=2835864 RepID=UPI001BDC56E5|nr:DUF1772 domain-containing protein [Nonomuraea sediminis]